MSRYNDARLAAVAVRKSQYPPMDRIEIAFAGRSNVGKSSLLNLITNRKKLAKISSSPGKTRTINFYDISDSLRIVDLPGYGYAKVSKSMSAGWGEMIEEYLINRENLVKVVQLVDIRHAPTKQDIQMYEFLKHYGLDGVVVATKRDKISVNEVFKAKKIIKDRLEMNEGEIFPISALKKTGVDEFISFLEDLAGRCKSE